MQQNTLKQPKSQCNVPKLSKTSDWCTYVVASSRIYQQEQAGLDKLNIDGLLLISAAPVMQFLWLPKNVLPHFRINQK